MSIHRKRKIGLALFLLLALAGAALWVLQPRNQWIVEKEFEGVIFHERIAPGMLGVMLTNDQTDTGYWTPSQADILKLEGQLRHQVRAQFPDLAGQLSGYKRQYFGFIRDGTPVIFVVGFCELSGQDWRETLVAMPQAGGCYFEAQYDAEYDLFMYVWELSGS